MLKIKFKDRFNSKNKGVIFGILLLIGLLSGFYYEKIENDKIIEAQVIYNTLQYENEKKAIEQNIIKIKNEEKLKIEKDSSNKLYNLAIKKIKTGNDKNAVILLDSALMIFPTNSEAKYSKALIYKKSGSYEKALEVLKGVWAVEGISIDEISLTKAECFLKLGKRRDAALALKSAAYSGNKKAKSIYDRINPIRRHLLYYQTMCCDGTPSPSNAKGRGACSHHGGVCNWNKPVYKEYREFEEQ